MSPGPIDDLTPYWNTVVRFIENHGFSREEAEDIAQSVFKRVSEHKEQYRGDAKWGFLKTATKFAISNAIRAKRAQKRNASEYSIDDLPNLTESFANNPWTGTPPQSAEELLIEKEQAAIRARRLADAIEQLPPVTRTCLKYWLGGVKYRDIATLMGITIDAVKARLHEARVELRERLNDDPGLRFP